ncbi:hypothetical protein [Flavobacterium sp.]|uniref:hypothetical protein n=1 Tax=Flavobacterium sp. TaxID=239 RepID=UPI002618B175|nr:hypothetical protein [Flavobacterium sp.]
MSGTICDIKGLNNSDLLFYTERYLQNDYVKANDAAKHIHLFNSKIRIDYALFGDLKSSIQRIYEKEKVYYFDAIIRSGPFETKNTTYTFLKNLELQRVLIEANGQQEDLLFSESLKVPEKLKIIKFFNNEKESQTEIIYNSFLEFDLIEEIQFPDGKINTWKKTNQSDSKYHFKENGQIFKFYVRNNSEEQSKTIVIYNSNFQILESKTYSQKNKSELLYEAIFHYSDHKLMKIVYVRHQSTKSFSGNFAEEFIFEYNEKDLLVKFKNNAMTKIWDYDKNENPILVTELNSSGSVLFETAVDYRYDKYNNWTYKHTKNFRNKVLFKESQTFREIEYLNTKE